MRSGEGEVLRKAYQNLDVLVISHAQEVAPKGHRVGGEISSAGFFRIWERLFIQIEDLVGKNNFPQSIAEMVFPEVPDAVRHRGG